MGCCLDNHIKQETKNPFQQQWIYFRNSELSNPEIFIQNKMKVFQYFYLCISKEYLNQFRFKVAQFYDIVRRSQSKSIKEINQFAGRVIEERKKVNERYKVMVETIQELKAPPHNIITDFISKINKQEKPDILPHSASNLNENKQNGCLQFFKGVKISEIQKVPQSISQSECNDEVGKYSSSYSIPPTIMSLSEINSKNHLGQGNAIQAIAAYYEQQNSRKQLMKRTILHLRQEKEHLDEEGKKFRQSIEGLKQQCQAKDIIIQQLNKQIEGLNFNIREMKSTREIENFSEEIFALKVTVKQYEQSCMSISRDKEKLSIQNKLLACQMKELSSSQEQKKLGIYNKLGTFQMKELSIIIAPSYQNYRKRSIFSIKEQFSQLIELKCLERKMKSEEMNVSTFISQSDPFDYLLRKKREELERILFQTSKILPYYYRIEEAIEARSIIAGMFETPPIYTEQLFAYDPISMIHFGKYIENKENLLILIKLENDMTLGAFAGRNMENNEVEESFIFSFGHQRQPLKLTAAKRIKKINLDNAFLNFGAGELRIKAKTLSLTCNIGSFQSIYTLNGATAPFQKLIGGNERNLTMKGYEIHQIHFQEDRL